MTQQISLTDEFQRHRSHLQAVAYRMLGSVSEAEDAVQEAWIRLDRAGPEHVENMGGWLTTVVGRVCLDALRARVARREDGAAGWSPEPVISVAADADPEGDALLADSVGLALLVVLDTLTPAERLAFVLHDMFDVPFDELAPIVDRSPAATRQLASRARRRVRGMAPPPDPDLRRQREVVAAFMAASRAGDFEALVEVLHPDVVFRVDGAGEDAERNPAITGASAVARRIVARGTRMAPHGQPAIVNGAAGVVVRTGGRLRAVVGFTIREGRVAAIDVITDGERLRRAAANL